MKYAYSNSFNSTWGNSGSPCARPGQLALCFIACFCGNVMGDDSSQYMHAQLHGFINQGFLKTDHNQFFGDSENGSWDFTDIGLAASIKPVKNLQISGQLLYRRAGEDSPDGVHLDYGLADLTLINSAQSGLGLRAGRVKNPYGFYNETRDITASRPSILLPESIYIDALRELFHTSDGANLYAYKTWGDKLLSFDAVLGKPEVTDSSQDAILAVSLPGTLTDEQLAVTRLMLEEDSGRWRLGYSYANLKADYQPSSPNPLVSGVDGCVEITLNLLSMEYNWNHWQATAEYQLRDIGYAGISPLHDGRSFTSEAYYLQTSYRVDQHWQWLLRYDQLYIDKSDKHGSQFTTASDAYAQDWTIGVRYQIDRHWLVSAELHKVDGTAWLSSQENPVASDQSGKWKLFTAQVSWRF